jgi:catechol 2,3-dioxygenase-like lactoylglutathione lyase family enzyme
MHISGLDHIVLNVQDVQRSLDFYRGCLGLAADRVDEWRRGAVSFPSLRINDATLIDLVGIVGAPGLAPNLAHFCLVTEDSDLADVVDQLRDAGVVVEDGPAIRSGARGDAVSIYFRDPDQNLIEVRTYARRPLVRAAIEDARSGVRATIDALTNPALPVHGNEAWSHKDLIAHLTSIEGWFRRQVEIAVYGQPWDLESVHDFNARAVAERRDWSMQQLADELEREAAAMQTLLDSVDESDLGRVIRHPQRRPFVLAEGWAMVLSHASKHVSELRVRSGKRCTVALIS